MGDEVLSPPPYFLSYMAQRSPTCALSHINVMRPKCIFIEKDHVK